MKLKRRRNEVRIVFQRKFDTCDPQDYIIEVSTGVLFPRRRGSMKFVVREMGRQICLTVDLFLLPMILLQEGTTHIIYATGSGPLKRLTNIRLADHPHGLTRTRFLKIMNPDPVLPVDTKGIRIINNRTKIRRLKRCTGAALTPCRRNLSHSTM